MYLLVGGSGFIGSRLAKRLKSSDASFRILDKRCSEAYPDLCTQVDIRDLGFFKKVIPDAEVLINLAAEHRDDVRPLNLYDQVNVDGARNVCEAADSKGINRIVFTSSVAVYGFADRGTDETGIVDPFNDYGRTKYEAEQIYRAWQQKDPERRSLVIIRPTVVFGEQNRGNVYNLLSQIASGKFLMIGSGQNIKSLAYVENVAAFIEFCCQADPGCHTYNYIDKPDFDMNQLVSRVKLALGKSPSVGPRVPYPLGLVVGYIFDAIAKFTGKSFPISSIRIRKFCKDTMYNTSFSDTGFVPPVDLTEAIDRTITYEFVEKIKGEIFYSE